MKEQKTFIDEIEKVGFNNDPQMKDTSSEESEPLL